MDQLVYSKFIGDTLPETNIAPANRPSQKETDTPTIHFQVRTVSFREGITPVRSSQFISQLATNDKGQ